jgi:diguanylate cyclase (GGDEF)-like protein/PAS domain S-box-containing protein
MRFFQKKRFFIILSIIVAIINSFFVILAYTQAKHNLHQQEYKLAQHYFATVDIAYQLAESQRNINSISGATLDISNIFSLVFNTLNTKLDVNAAILFDATQQHVNNSPAINGFIIGQATDEPIKSLMLSSTDYQQISPQDSPLNVQIRTLNTHHYLYATKPLVEYLDPDDSNEKDVSQLVIWQEMSALHTQLNNQLKINIYYAIVVFLIFELLILLSLRHLSTGLKIVANNHQQTVALTTRNKVLEQLVQGETLATLLESIVIGIEQSDTAEICSILLLDSDGKHLLLGAAPHLPDLYNETINGIEIGYNVGSCGNAAYRQTRVIVDDIQSNPLWTNYKDLAAKTNLAACWSEPIIGTNNTLLGTFAIYHHQVTSPSQQALKLLESAANLAAVVIEHHRANEQHQLSSLVFNASHEGIMIIDSLKKIITVNPMFSEITGYSSEEIIGKSPSIFNSNKHSSAFYDEIWQSVLSEGHWQGEVWNRRKNGKIYAELLSITSLMDESGQAHHYICLFSDVTYSKEQHQSLEVMAHYDVLTQLPNRALFADRFEQSIARSKRNDTLLAVCFLDLDNFKPINDNYGHDIGDKILIEVAVRLKLALREEDTVSRQGGDEFALLLSNFKSFEQCEALLNRIHHSLAEPYLIGEDTHHISASSGTTIYPLDDGDIDSLIRHADQAMYQSKLAGKNNYRFFDATDDDKIITQHSKLEELRHALENNDLTLYYQPKVNMKTGQVFGAEALIRWLHPEKGLIPPLDFLPILEGTQLEIIVGDWVINTALKQAELWKKQGIELEISVNISSAHLQSPLFITELNEALLRHPTIDPNNFQLEILESSALGDIESIRSILQTCRELIGVNIALDDFGTGYSSLTHLRILHANTIKIDQSFIRNMLDDPNDYAIIEGIIGLADSFARTVIAEGVETTAHGITLLLLGCHKAQGYAISRPLPDVDFPDWFESYQPNKEWMHMASLKLTPKETKIKLLLLSVQYWYETFKHKQGSRSNNSKKWPLMNPKQCQHGAWLKRAHNEQLFDNDWLQDLQQTHESMHLIATDIMIKHQNKDQIVNSSDLDKLYLAYEKIMLSLDANSQI